MIEPIENPTLKELHSDVCAAYEFASRLTTTRICSPETYKERAWFIWKVLSNCADFMFTQLEAAKSKEG